MFAIRCAHTASFVGVDTAVAVARRASMGLWSRSFTFVGPMWMDLSRAAIDLLPIPEERVPLGE